MRAAAFFDIDGTLTRTTILHPLIWYRRAHYSWPRFSWFCLGLAVRAPWYAWVDHRSRGQFNIVFYRRYKGLNAEDLRFWHRRTFADNLQPRLFPAALSCVRRHQAQGHPIVLVTGGLELVMQPLADFLGADLLAARLESRDGILTGEMNGPPVADVQKANLIRSYAEQHAIDLSASFAYGNSLGDAPMLECVGNPVAVNPDRRLGRLAKERGWQALECRKNYARQDSNLRPTV